MKNSNLEKGTKEILKTSGDTPLDLKLLRLSWVGEMRSNDKY